MLKELERLSSSEVECMVKAPLLVCILIGADNKIDNKEINGAIELAQTEKMKASVAEFYNMIKGPSFS